MNKYVQDPKLVKQYEDEGVLRFILQGIPLCMINGLRRTILSDIPIVVIRTESSAINECTVHENTSRFHNEIVKQRLSCVPFMTKDLKDFSEKYTLKLDVQNKSDYEMRMVTTDDFIIQNKTDNSPLEDSEMKKLLPHDELTDYPIEFLRLRPSIGSTVPGEKISLTANFSVSTAKENGMFNAVSKCAYHFVIDPEARDNVWSFYHEKLKAEGMSEEEIEFEKRNYNNLDAYRAFKSDSKGNPTDFEFEVKTIGQYTNYEIVQLGFAILRKKFENFIADLKDDKIPLHLSDESRTRGYHSVVSSNMETSHDLILEEEDYTMGYILEHYLYEMYFNKEQAFKYIGFKKYHPHDDYSVLRVDLINRVGSPKAIIAQKIIESCQAVIDVIQRLEKMFKQ